MDFGAGLCASGHELFEIRRAVLEASAAAKNECFPVKNSVRT